MKRHSIAFLIHPYKNSLTPKNVFREAVNAFAAAVLDIGSSYQNLRFNIVLPGYFLEAIDPMVLLELREMHKKGNIEWLTTGYTEPFISFSPDWLLRENLKSGAAAFTELVGAKPAGFVPPFSNWEPSVIDVLRGSGLGYTVLSRSLLSPQFRVRCGYWTTECGGSPMVLFPAHSVFPSAVIPNMERWIEQQFSYDEQPYPPVKLLCIDFLCPLLPTSPLSAGEGLAEAAKVLDKLLLSYQPVRFTEFLSSSQALGLLYLPQSLSFRRDESDTEPHFLNYLHSFDQIGIIQRKLMDIADAIASRRESKQFEPFKKTLFFAQDINRYIPAKSSGITRLSDRRWSFERLIDIEHQLREHDRISGGHVRIFDFLRNGGKCIVMTNKNMAVYIDHLSGGSIFEIDVRRRRYNVCAGYNPARHTLPMVIEPGLSYTAFIDRLVKTDTSAQQYRLRQFTERGDFYFGGFEYRIKKTETGIKAALSRQGTLLQGDKNCPLSMEKVFGLEKDRPTLPFVYQLTNHSLTPYDFRLAVELTFSLPGLSGGTALLMLGKTKHGNPGAGPLEFSGVTEWRLADPSCGIMIHCMLQKPVDLWCFPAAPQDGGDNAAEAVTMVMSSPVAIEGSAVWTLMGKLEFKRHALVRRDGDEI